jgi:hypothetical protein
LNRTISPHEALTEAQFQASVIAMATDVYQWEVFHDGDSRRSNAGFPDLVLVKGGKLMAGKTGRGGVFGGQRPGRGVAAFQQLAGGPEWRSLEISVSVAV